jgi:hypothetical protein
LLNRELKTKKIEKNPTKWREVRDKGEKKEKELQSIESAEKETEDSARERKK